MSSSKQARRLIILDAVIKLLASRGLEGVTHRAIDEAAGLPQGSSTYYFPKKEALLVEASRHLAELLEKDCDELQLGFAEIAARQGVDAAVDYVAKEVVSYADTARDLFLARMELTLAASRREELADVGDLLTAAARRPIEFFLQLISEGRKDMPIETCAALIDGISLMHATGQGPKPTTDQIAAVFRAVL
ncbi:MAG: TetR family transcriptional regulator [Hoeflea sp.]|uniref:TetR/AcrR family transcriptional regulator n=1 Tax=Hoeflea sp. TaxID=1940281 RepID=UPI001D92EBE8|nr:TetR/AcrR family transcriptional regulator [Hoeflea sp.]MBU4529953.1 TetR family transcriptional regulator [Alphaproteobacteria bacterium]MBU4543180.1 TetR family transcriptional regulator [Alphaproteobacteria bacterium]MBU4550280.1 TetR family transcriptional regulator [Alphaproteobacteria bacterium]MBV1722446.1 TetR family transcriptional regulator [Hoeflea sp.]MBV1761596.1 TetR family transcriptional regulator [Hoeflea sp.]